MGDPYLLPAMRRSCLGHEHSSAAAEPIRNRPGVVLVTLLQSILPSCRCRSRAAGHYGAVIILMLSSTAAAKKVVELIPGSPYTVLDERFPV